MDSSYHPVKILNHYIKDGSLVFKVLYDGNSDTKIWDVPYKYLSKDVPVDTAKVHQRSCSRGKKKGILFIMV